MKKILFLASMLLVSMVPTMAQEKKSEEKALMQQYYDLLFQKKDTVKANKTKAKLLKKYPKGDFARRNAAEKLWKLQGEEFNKAAEQFRKDFPIADFYANPDGGGHIYVNFYRSYSRKLWDEKNYDKLVEVMKEMEFSGLSELYSHTVMFYIMKRPDEPKTYVDIAEKMFAIMAEKSKTYVDMYNDGLSPKQSQQDALNYYTTVEAEVLMRSGRVQEGIDLMNTLPEDVRYNQYPKGNQLYAEALMNQGKKEEAVKAMMGAASTGMLTKKLGDMLKAYYNECEPKPAATYDQFLNSLKTPTYLENVKAHVAAGLENEPFKPFEMMSIKDTKVSSADWANDDIVVLDFWATWCAPCVAALEGMQMAVNKYKDDPKVKFYFVDTQDKAGDKSGPERVWKRKNLSPDDMLVLFDNSEEGKEDMSVVYRSLFPGTSGIPKKIVLKGGKIRYRAEGYGGSPSGLMDEISAIVELLKEEKE
ncbi:MAG: thioredoxin domain-containing protein [Prevotella sp.]|nr:thioredoxin domain-containing protein [Prevotella sp.]MDD7226226.1 thioredoxin domain-containing protein [Prevotella sp.]MDY4556214.1 thioredoxin domain-containing protein [Prevotella sp.]